MGETRIQLVQWDDQSDALRAIREAVFIQEQNVPIELEWDEFDSISWHVLAFNRAGEPVGTARLLPDGHIGRMAVLLEWRGQGIGRLMLQRLLEEADKQGMKTVKLHAQTTAMSFYQQYGFVAIGEIFIEAGIPHIEMALKR